jgi:aminoglycoside phosphotransferase
MLHNPWRTRLSGYDGPPLDEAGLSLALEKLVRQKLGTEYNNGFGNGACVAIGKSSVVKIAPFPVHRDRFDHERAVSGLEIPGVNIPSIIDEGVTDDYEWIELTVVPGRPVFEVWNDISEHRKHELMTSLARCISAIQSFRPQEALPYSQFGTWRNHVTVAVDRSIVRATDVVPASVIERARHFAESAGEQLFETERVLCHGDLWFGNVFVDDQGALTGIFDWDRLAIATAEYEIDMIWRSWKYPLDFVPPEYRDAFQSPLPSELMKPIVDVCRGQLTASELNARLSMLELAFRLGMTARTGWNSETENRLNTILDGNWTADLPV